jgi:oxaloacetate decarboxylase gamma subunit
MDKFGIINHWIIAGLRRPASKTYGGYMTIVDMLEQSGVLTLLGMGIVFSFLVILIICVSLAGKIIAAIGANEDLRRSAPPSSGGAAPAGNANVAVTAAISAAVAEYRKSNS